MRGLAGRTGHQSIAVIMGEHQRSEDMPVSGCKAMNVRSVEARSLQSLVKKILVRIEMRGIRCIDDFQFAKCIAQSLGLKSPLHI